MPTFSENSLHPDTVRGQETCCIGTSLDLGIFIVFFSNFGKIIFYKNFEINPPRFKTNIFHTVLEYLKWVFLYRRTRPQVSLY